MHSAKSEAGIPASLLSSPSPLRRRRRRRAPRDVQLSIPEPTWLDVRDAMLSARPGGNEEVFGFLICDRQRTRTQDRYIVRHWVVPTIDDYVRQSSGGLTLSQRVHIDVLTTYVPRGYHIVHLHTHPGSAFPYFSRTDDGDEIRQATALHHLSVSSRLISGVFNQDMSQGQARIWSGQFGTHRPVELRIGWIPAPAERPSTMAPAIFDRQRIFGEDVQQRLGNLRVALIGCGGLGAPFAEQLSRLGVRSWILVDDDRIETTNLHRLPFATREMADRNMPKVRYVGQLIQRFWDDRASVVTLPISIAEPVVQQRIAGADLIVVATDNHTSRLIAQQVAVGAQRPLLCLGTHIDIPEGGEGPRLFSRVTMPPLQGGWCLACGQVIDLHIVAQETADPTTRQQLREGGYLPEVSAPAVYWLNTFGAAMGVRLVHGLVAGFLDATEGIDDLHDLASGDRMPIQHGTEGCFVCTPVGNYGAVMYGT